MKKYLISIILICILFSACGNTHNGENTSSPDKTVLYTDEKTTVSDESHTEKASLSKVQQLLAEMTLKEKIGQLMIIRPDALDFNLTSAQLENTKKYGTTALSAEMESTLSQYPVGGVVMFGKNINTPSQIQKYIASLQKNSKISMFIAVDEEGGSVSRISNSSNFDVKKYDNMEKIGATKNADNANAVGNTIGTYLKKYGFNLDFAPDADVNTNPDNIVIGKRSFGSEPQLVGEMVAAEVSGFHSAGVMCCIKHFPGHGDTKGDTHKGFVAVDKTWDELKNCEIIPFNAGISAGTDLVMVAHITAENVTGNSLPSSLSYEIVTNKLRKELGFNGVVITDSMSMGAITTLYSSSDAAVKAIAAGADIILMPESLKEAFDSITNAVNNGELSETRIDESVLRILNLKEKYGLLK